MYKAELDLPTTQNVDNSNTQDPFVPNPQPYRHEATKMTTSGDTDMPAQPNDVNYSHLAGCRYIWTGYIKIDSALSNPTLLVGADDWGEFVLEAFPDHTVAVEREESEIGEYRGGQYKENSIMLEGITLKPGFYRTTISYVNVDYQGPGSNAARLSVKLNGQNVELYTLRAVNLMSREKAEKFRKGYTGWYIDPDSLDYDLEDEVENQNRRESSPYGPVDYVSVYSRNNFWAKFHFSEEQYQERLNDQPCASRLSVAINRAGYNIGAYKIGGKQVADNTAGWGSDLIVLNPEATSESERTKKHIIRGASDMQHYLRNALFAGKAPDFIESDDLQYDSHCNPREGDIVIFASSGHAGLSTDGSSAIGFGFPQGDVWILYRSDWDAPTI